MRSLLVGRTSALTDEYTMPDEAHSKKFSSCPHRYIAFIENCCHCGVPTDTTQS